MNEHMVNDEHINKHMVIYEYINKHMVIDKYINKFDFTTIGLCTISLFK